METKPDPIPPATSARISVVMPCYNAAPFVREAVEADMVKLVAQTRNSAVVPDLRRQIAAQRAVIDSHPENFMRLDEEFHRSLATAAGKSQVFKVVANVKAQMDRVRYLTLMHRSVIMISIDQHDAVVDAIERGDPMAADEAMRTHLRQILTDLPHVAKLKPDFFENIDFQSNAA